MALAKILTLFCIALFGVMGLLLLTSRVKRALANTLLGVFFLLWALNFLDGYLLLDGFYLKFPQLALWEEPLAFLYGPIVYFYVKTLVKKLPPWKWLHLFHLIPYLVLLFTVVMVYHIHPLHQQKSIIENVMQLEQSNSVFVSTVLVISHILIYMLVAFRLVRQHHQKLKEYYASFDTTWLTNTLKYLISILLLSLVVSFLQFYGGHTFFTAGLLILSLVMLIFISKIVFRAFEQPELFQLDPSTRTVKSLSEPEQGRLEGSIRKVLDADKIYLNPDLTLLDLARAVEASPRQTSEVINDRFHQNFFELINSLRIQEAQQLFKNANDAKLTVSEVMYQVGFNSKSSFNTQFKKKAGMTPSEFKKLHS